MEVKSIFVFFLTIAVVNMEFYLSPLPYFATAPYFALMLPSAPDISAPDLSASDLSAPDLSTTDLSAPDLSASDLSAPDLSAPDLSATDLSAPDLAAPKPLAPQESALPSSPNQYLPPPRGPFVNDTPVIYAAAPMLPSSQVVRLYNRKFT